MGEVQRTQRLQTAPGQLPTPILAHPIMIYMMRQHTDEQEPHIPQLHLLHLPHSLTVYIIVTYITCYIPT